MSKQANNTQKRRRRVAEVIGYIVIFLIIALLLVVLYSKMTNHTVFIFDRTTAWVMTPSMEPQIPAQSYILVRKADVSKIKVGDVIMFKSDDPSIGGAFNTHRVEAIIGDNEEFVTKGIANIAKDEYTAKAENVVGVYEKNLPVMTAIGRFLFSGIGILITVTVIFVIIMIIYVPDIIKANKARTEEIERRHREQIDERIREEVERLKAENAAKNADDAEHDEQNKPNENQ